MNSGLSRSRGWGWGWGCRMPRGREGRRLHAFCHSALGYRSNSCRSNSWCRRQSWWQWLLCLCVCVCLCFFCCCCCRGGRVNGQCGRFTACCDGGTSCATCGCTTMAATALVVGTGCRGRPWTGPRPRPVAMVAKRSWDNGCLYHRHGVATQHHRGRGEGVTVVQKVTL